MKTLIIDDIDYVAQSLKQLIEEFCPDVSVLGIANSVEEAKPLIDTLKPDLIFLDIQMPNQSGFDLLLSFEKIDFSVIFVTAFSEYAIKAVKFGALDYILKPVDIEELKIAIDKARLKTEEKTKEIENLLHNLKSPGDKSNTIIIHSEKGFDVIKLEDIIRIEADGNYSRIYTTNGTRFLSSKSLKKFEQYLENEFFVRIHHSHIVNLYQIEKLNLKGESEVILKNGEHLPVSFRKRQDVINSFQRF
jgi:two-component system, LytTR family, response regulator